MMLPLLAAAMALAVETAILSHRQLQLQHTADAVALATANALAPTNLLDVDDLVRDILLTDRADRQDLVLNDARLAAARYSLLNPFPGGETPLDLNPTNALTGELLLGTLDGPDDAPAWHAMPFPGPELYSPHFNVVRVQMERLDVRVTATAYLDRDVVGFKAQGSVNVPLVPIAVLTDWLDAMNTKSWEYNIIESNGTDFYSLDASELPVGDSGTPIPDGIREITVRITGDAADNGQMFALPASGGFSGALSQIAAGVTRDQLAEFNDPGPPELRFDGADNQKSVTRLTEVDIDFEDLALALQAIRGKRRIFPLFDQANGTVRLVGFVAARVMNVVEENAPPAVEVVLQPTMLLTATALTDRMRRAYGPREVKGVESIFNPYIARVRLLK